MSRKIPSVHCWTEDIDEATVAGLAYTYEVRRRSEYQKGIGYVIRRYIYGLSVFVLVDRQSGRWRAREAATGRLNDLAAKTGFQFIGPADGVADTT